MLHKFKNLGIILLVQVHVLLTELKKNIVHNHIVQISTLHMDCRNSTDDFLFSHIPYFFPEEPYFWRQEKWEFSPRVRHGIQDMFVNTLLTPTSTGIQGYRCLLHCTLKNERKNIRSENTELKSVYIYALEATPTKFLQ